jgi:mannose-6-phosphate isomerase
MTDGFSPAQTDAARDFVTYVMRDMAHLWAGAGWNDAGAHSHERLRPDLAPAALGYRRGMAVGRQMFFFSHAWRLTGEALFAERAHALYADLTTRFWDERNGGWFFSLDGDGAPADTTKDLYAHAFAMFGLAHYGAIFGNVEAFDWASRTNDVVERLHLSQGWNARTASRDWMPLDTALEQNPHMHLFEAYLSLHAATGDSCYRADAERIVALYTDRLCSPDKTKVIEFFDSNGVPLPDKGRRIEPGHSYEWYWLLNEYAEGAHHPVAKEIAAPLMAWAGRYGVDGRHGGIYSYVDPDGAILDDRKRVWAATECIKAHTVPAREAATPDAYAALSDWIAYVMKTHFAGAGRWHEYVRRDLHPDSDFMPSSTPYHFAMAALEVDRVLGGRGAFGLTAAA